MIVETSLTKSCEHERKPDRDEVRNSVQEHEEGEETERRPTL
jgi:hypothetical protein